jgi:hypothetical protein
LFCAESSVKFGRANCPNHPLFGSDPKKDKPLGIWRDADGVRWKHLGNQKYERVG